MTDFPVGSVPERTRTHLLSAAKETAERRWDGRRVVLVVVDDTGRPSRYLHGYCAVSDVLQTADGRYVVRIVATEDWDAWRNNSGARGWPPNELWPAELLLTE